MRTLCYKWNAGKTEHELRLVAIPRTAGKPYLFGAGANRRSIEIRDFHMTSTPVTQALWTHVMGSNPAERDEPAHPVTGVSWDHIAGAGGFLERINSSEILAALGEVDRALRFRLPTETEWEYAARGGPHWTDGFRFSGSDDPDEVAWYGPRWRRADQALVNLLGWRSGWRLANRIRKLLPRRTRTHLVGAKASNQLGLFDMSGNVWEWCEDVCTEELEAVPGDGRPYVGPGTGRRLRGGCHHNWDIHCTVWFRYGIEQNAHDGCIGFRLALAPASPLR